MGNEKGGPPPIGNGPHSSVLPADIASSGASEIGLARLTHLRALLSVCPSDTHIRRQLAALLETLGLREEALLNWNAILSVDPNSLVAREGAARCRQKLGGSSPAAP